MMETLLNLVVGSLGLCLVLSAFILENLGIFRKYHSWYNMISGVGSLFLIYYAFALDSLIFIILNSVWVIFAVYFLIKHKQ